MLKTERALTSVSIAIRDLQTGEMKPFMDIMDEWSGKWNTLNDTQRMYIGDARDSARRLSTVLATVQANTRATELYNIAMNGTGSAMKAQEEWATSLEAKLQELSSSINVFWQTFVSSEGYGATIVMFTELINGVTTLVDKFGSATVAVPALTLVLLSLTKGGRWLTKELVTGGFALSTFGKKAVATSAGIKTVETASAMATVKIVAMQSVLTGGLSLALSLVIGGLSAFAIGMNDVSKIPQ